MRRLDNALVTGEPIRYTTASDGVRIAFVASGDGPPLLHLPTGALSSIVLERRLPARRRWIAALERHFRVIRYDPRAHGLSQREVGAWNWESFIDDAVAVLDALGIESAAVLGYLGSAQMAAVVAARHPQRVSRVVIWPGDFRAPRIGEAIQFIKDDWNSYSELWGHMAVGWDHGEEARIMAAVLRESIAPETYLWFMSVFNEATPALYEEAAQGVFAPVLAVQSPPKQDPDGRTAFLAAFRDCTTEIIEGLGNAPYLGDMTAVVHAIARFAGSERASFETELTAREREVLHLVGRGMSNQEIAAELVLSTRTVEQHLGNAYAKLGLEGKSARSAAAAYLARHERSA